MLNNEFSQPISVDFAPHFSLCEWCGKPAEEQITAIGGAYHNKGGFFCHACGELFTHAVANSLCDSPIPEIRASAIKWADRVCSCQ
jgi:hypothetical protein